MVPTQRLWTKINDSIEQKKNKQSFWTPIFAFFRQPAFAAFAGLLIVAGLFALVVNRAATEENQPLAKVESKQTPINVPIRQSIEINSETLPLNEEAKFVAASNVKINRVRTRIIQANAPKENPNRKLKNEKREVVEDAPSPITSENLTGEDSYLKTIATLTETVNTRKDEVLKPSARFAFERDMAVADDAIKTMKPEIKQNPNDDSAKQVLRASYQNKIDLLNSVADKTDLMASIR